MATAPALPPPSSPAGDDLAPKYPEPMEFLTKDYIHPDNQAINQREAQRWRLLGFFERMKLQRYANALLKDLRKGHYNQIVLERHALARHYRAAKAAYRTATYINDAAKREARDELYAMYERAVYLKQAFDALKPTHELFVHYQGWLDYERQHRKELQKEAQRERKIRAEMRRESKWIEKLMLDVFRKTPGCHYTYKKEGEKKEKTKTPKFERVEILPDAHYFRLAASRHILWWHKYLLPPTVKPTRLIEDDVIMALRVATKRQVAPIVTDQSQLIFRVARLDSPDALPRSVKWRDGMKYFPDDLRARLPYPVGVTENRKWLFFDFATDANVLVAGKQGSGKSNLVNGIIGAVVAMHSPAEVRLVLIDQKGGIEFTHWAELPHLLWEMVKTLDGVEPVLKRLITVMKRRMAILEKAHAKNIDEYNRRVDIEDQMERVLLVIDEMNTFVGLGAQTEEIHNLLMLLTSQGRACGVHVIAATQYPEVKVVPGRIKGNMGIRLSGYMPSVVASQVVLDNPEANRIPNHPGRMAGTSGLRDFVVQVGRMEDGDIAHIVTSSKQLYQNVRNELRHMKDAPKMTVWDEQRVLKAALDWMEGHLGAQKLHKLLKDESPNERHLQKMCRSLIDEAETTGYVTLNEDGCRYRVVKRGKGYYLDAIPDAADRSDETTAPEIAPPASEGMSDDTPAVDETETSAALPILAAEVADEVS